MDRPELRPIVDLIHRRHRDLGRGVIVGLAGGVAAGKSTLAAELADGLSVVGLGAAIVSTDGFLHPNRVLVERGLSDRKGFPESYDHEALHHFLDAISDGCAVEVPVHDHRLSDISEATQLVEPADVVIVEGVNALDFADRFDLSIYLHADADDLHATFIGRVLEMREAARTEHSPFFEPWTNASDEEFLAMASMVWDTVNLRNLTDHIEPTRAHADVVVVRDAEHRIRSIEPRSN